VKNIVFCLCHHGDSFIWGVSLYFILLTSPPPFGGRVSTSLYMPLFPLFEASRDIVNRHTHKVGVSHLKQLTNLLFENILKFEFAVDYSKNYFRSIVNSRIGKKVDLLIFNFLMKQFLSR